MTHCHVKSLWTKIKIKQNVNGTYTKTFLAEEQNKESDDRISSKHTSYQSESVSSRRCRLLLRLCSRKIALGQVLSDHLRGDCSLSEDVIVTVQSGCSRFPILYLQPLFTQSLLKALHWDKTGSKEWTLTEGCVWLWSCHNHSCANTIYRRNEGF